MLKILDRYISKTIMSATAVATAVIIALLFMMNLLTEFKDIGEGDYGFYNSVVYVLLKLPNAIYQFSPILILLGCIVGLSLLTASRELAVMRASGFSMKRIVRSVLAGAFVLIIIITAIGELLGPVLSHKAEMYKENLQNGGQTVVTSSGVWLHVNNNFIHIQRAVGKQLLVGVTRYQFDKKHRLLAATFAKRMTNSDNEWIMHDVVQTSFTKTRARSQSFATLKWDLPFNKNLLNAGSVEPDELSLGKLQKYAKYLEGNGIQSIQYKFEYWERIFTPIASLVMIFLAIPFVLGAMRQSAMGWRLLVGVMMGFGFFIMNSFLAQLAIVYQVPPVLAALTPILLFIAIGIILSKKLITT